MSSRRRRKGSTNGRDTEEEYPDITTGPLKDRKFGLRIDDDVLVRIMAGDSPIEVEGRILRHTTTALELIDTKGTYHWISNDWVIEVVLKRHNRPHPSDDPEYKKPKKGAEKPKANKEKKGQQKAGEVDKEKESVYYV